MSMIRVQPACSSSYTTFECRIKLSIVERAKAFTYLRTMYRLYSNKGQSRSCELPSADGQEAQPQRFQNQSHCCRFQTVNSHAPVYLNPRLHPFRSKRLIMSCSSSWDVEYGVKHETVKPRTYSGVLVRHDTSTRTA